MRVALDAMTGVLGGEEQTHGRRPVKAASICSFICSLIQENSNSRPGGDMGRHQWYREPSGPIDALEQF